MKRRLLDSDALSAFLAGREPTTRHVREYLDVMPCLTMSVKSRTGCPETVATFGAVRQRRYTSR